MSISRVARALRLACPPAVAALALALAGSTDGTAADAPKPAGADAGFFFKVEKARDCVYDAKRQRLYVTNEAQLVVLDARERKTVKSIDLPGKVRACDITADCKHLAVAPYSGAFLYWIDLDDLEVSQVNFKAEADETGVHDLCVGIDGSVLLTTVFQNGERTTGAVKLRRIDPASAKVTEVRSAPTDSVVSASADRKFAAVGDANAGPGSFLVYDFREQKLRDPVRTSSSIFEIACGPEARNVAVPLQGGCELYDAKGGRIANLSGKTVICAAFHPKAERVFLLRAGEKSLQEYAVEGQKLVNEYPLEKPLKIYARVTEQKVTTVERVGKNKIVGNTRPIRTVHYKAFQSGRVRVSDDGEKVFVVTPEGVYMFATKAPSASEAPKFKVIEAK
jgi:hypothetical protein